MSVSAAQRSCLDEDRLTQALGPFPCDDDPPAPVLSDDADDAYDVADLDRVGRYAGRPDELPRRALCPLARGEALEDPRVLVRHDRLHLLLPLDLDHVLRLEPEPVLGRQRRVVQVEELVEQPPGLVQPAWRRARVPDELAPAPAVLLRVGQVDEDLGRLRRRRHLDDRVVPVFLRLYGALFAPRLVREARRGAHLRQRDGLVLLRQALEVARALDSRRRFPLLLLAAHVEPLLPVRLMHRDDPAAVVDVQDGLVARRVVLVRQLGQRHDLADEDDALQRTLVEPVEQVRLPAAQQAQTPLRPRVLRDRGDPLFLCCWRCLDLARLPLGNCLAGCEPFGRRRDDPRRLLDVVQHAPEGVHDGPDRDAERVLLRVERESAEVRGVAEVDQLLSPLLLCRRRRRRCSSRRAVAAPPLAPVRLRGIRRLERGQHLCAPSSADGGIRIRLGRTGVVVASALARLRLFRTPRRRVRAVCWRSCVLPQHRLEPRSRVRAAAWILLSIVCYPKGARLPLRSCERWHATAAAAACARGSALPSHLGGVPHSSCQICPVPSRLRYRACRRPSRQHVGSRSGVRAGERIVFRCCCSRRPQMIRHGGAAAAVAIIARQARARHRGRRRCSYRGMLAILPC